MHETLHNKIKGYIDVNVVFNKHIYVKGWCFHTDFGTCQLRVTGTKDNIIVDIQDRPDVAKFYNNNEINKSGWAFKYVKGNTVELEMKVANKWLPVFKFNSTDTNMSEIHTIDKPL